jgi:hypothetical protein
MMSYQDIFSSEAMSYAIAEISEHLVMRMTDGTRSKRANRGFDIISGSEKIEVKARFVGKYREDDVHFNFGRHSRSADTGFCLLWQANEGERAVLKFAVRAPIESIASLWGKRDHPKYLARPTVKQLKAAL